MESDAKTETALLRWFMHEDVDGPLKETTTCTLKGKYERYYNRRGAAATLQVAGTCGGFIVQGFKEGALMHPIQANHVGGVGIQPGDDQAQSVSGQSEVLTLSEILHVCYLNNKAVKVSALGAPGRSEAVPCNVRDGEVHHRRLQLRWEKDTSDWVQLDGNRDC